jgi:ketosteroid isomerase-like protein
MERPGDEAMNDAHAVVLAFNEAINERDLASLSALMSEDHRFLDSADVAVDGKAACVEAWRSFFAAFPGYRNHFGAIVAGDDEVIVDGRSECSVPALAGPARWRVRVRGGVVQEWRVQDPDEPERP